MARDLAVVGTFCLLILIPGVGQMLGYSSVADIAAVEFREPAPAPTLPTSREQWQALPGVVEAYLDDHLGWRFELGWLQATLLASLGSSAHDQVMIGNDGWLFLGTKELVDDLRGVAPPSEEQVANWVDGVTTVHRALSRLGIDHVITIIPSKSSVYPQHLPAWAQPRGPNRYAILAERMNRQRELPFVDVREVALAHKAEGEWRLYRKLDTHGTDHLGYLSYLRIMDELASQRPGLRVLQQDELVVTTERLTGPSDLHRFLHATPVLSEPLLVTYRVDPLRHKVRAARVVDGNQWREVPVQQTHEMRLWGTAIHSNAANDLTILVYGDSFTVTMRPFLIHTFMRTVFVRHREAALDSDMMRAVQPDVVLVNLNERALWQPPRLVSVSPALEPLVW